jgi:hypothetical protein
MKGAWEKWLRGQHLADQFRRQAARLMNGDANPPLIQITHHIDVEAHAVVFRVGDVPPIPSDAASLAAEAAHHFRAALNYVVRELAWIDTHENRKVADRQQDFPIVTNPSGWGSDRVQLVTLQGLNKRHRRMLEHFQPYRRLHRATAESHPLAVLQALTNDDKHRLPNRLYYRLAYIGPVIGADRPGHNCRVDLAQTETLTHEYWSALLFRELTPGLELFRLPLIIDGPDPSIDLLVEGLTYIAIGQGLPIAQSLMDIGETVTEILRTFEPEFAGPVARKIWIERSGSIGDIPAPTVTTPIRRRMRARAAPVKTTSVLATD